MITILCGKSASGKDTLLRELIKNEGFAPLISTTSRPIRENEVDGRDYNFTTKEDFIANLDNFLEYRTYNTLVAGNPDVWYYGMPKMELDPVKDYAVVLDFEGMEAFRNYYGKENCYVCYIDASNKVRENRAKQRGSFDQTEWDRRFKDDTRVFSSENIKKAEIDGYLLNNTKSLKALTDELMTNISVYKTKLHDIDFVLE